MAHFESERLLWERGEWDHVPYPILEAYVNETLDDIDREIVEGHFVVCEACVAEARVLHAERAALVAESALPVPVTKTPTQKPTQRPPWWLPILTGGAGACVAAGVLWSVVVRPLEQGSHRTEQALEQARAEATQTKQRLAADQERVAQLQGEYQSTQSQLEEQRRALAALRQQAVRRESPAPRGRATTPPAPPLPVARRTALELPDLSELRKPILRAPESAEGRRPLTLLTPLGTRVRGVQPRFSWQAVPQAERYEVLVADSQDTVLVQESVRAGATHWTPPVALPRGKLLLWEVHAYDAAGQALATGLGGRFAVLTLTQENALAGQLQRTPGREGQVRALARFGVLEEARALLQSRKEEATAQAWLQQLERYQQGR